jgi:myo-inositol-1(or 4)-monophosphatase
MVFKGDQSTPTITSSLILCMETLTRRERRKILMQEEDVIIAACHAARAGGAILRSYFGQPLPIQEKQGADIVTEADLAAEKIICYALHTSSSDFNIFPQEQGLLEEESEYTWIVDPLDGTNNFVVGIPQFGVSIALTYRQERDPAWRGVSTYD